ncbi:hypothetical protein [Pseudoblastomonas halimionae]|uniref:Chorismate lyase n=1 Tax=Alteriqipengyuania halimionae TaxID=1926630 RepID=A0A6I4U1W6_9SPHN|nr:hypothetical protein [Alteriqipengyuania halimionae]MXP10010.1 hypothetical protein [Alteriqipengyuania halimionae]
MRTRLYIAAIATATLAACATTPSDRIRDRFEAQLAGNESATAALQGWCAKQGMADPAKIVVEHMDTNGEEPADAIRQMLEVEPDEPLGYRHVRLVCGSTVMSVAHNWYVPGRLTPAMNETLETTNTPFGRAVAELGFTRQRLQSIRGPGVACPSETILTHRAVLRRKDTKPISTVIECYTPANLAD